MRIRDDNYRVNVNREHRKYKYESRCRGVATQSHEGVSTSNVNEHFTYIKVVRKECVCMIMYCVRWYADCNNHIDT